uniref:Ribonuclease H protein At1g65750 n=1 Tax=Cajanus cajan TaxID=3821 RepID=A0A151U8H5_CAJCA|nr:Putative ribonuclease H protein At1g65750 [Cajanus cajan]
MDQVEVIQSCLDLFYSSSGQKVNVEKTRIFFSENVAYTVIMWEEISNAFGFSRTDNLGRYLGIPVHHTQVRRRDYQVVICQVTTRLSGWKALSLSFVGRLTLCKFVLAAILAYTMQSIHIPHNVCDEVDRLCRSFL